MRWGVVKWRKVKERINRQLDSRWNHKRKCFFYGISSGFWESARDKRLTHKKTPSFYTKIFIYFNFFFSTIESRAEKDSQLFPFNREIFLIIIFFLKYKFFFFFLFLPFIIWIAKSEEVYDYCSDFFVG